jgi:hypothetical protein
MRKFQSSSKTNWKFSELLLSKLNHRNLSFKMNGPMILVRVVGNANEKT